MENCVTITGIRSEYLKENVKEIKLRGSDFFY